MGRPSKYPIEFRGEAVKLVLDAGRAIRDVAESLELKTETLRKWVNAEKVERGLAAGVPRAQLEELDSLKRENRKLKQQVDILEKATVFLSHGASTSASSVRVHRACALEATTGHGAVRSTVPWSVSRFYLTFLHS